MGKQAKESMQGKAGTGKREYGCMHRETGEGMHANGFTLLHQASSFFEFLT
jgi:hypothetical protein